MNVWDKIGALAPTKDAAVATSGGDRYEPDINMDAGRIHSDVPVSFRAPSSNEIFNGMEDLTGRRIGRLLILGLGPRVSKTARWVCRCDCGRYGAFSSRSLRRTSYPEGMMCVECNHVQQLRHHASRRPTSASRKTEQSFMDGLAVREKEKAAELHELAASLRKRR